MTVETHWSDIAERQQLGRGVRSSRTRYPHNEARGQIWDELLAILMDKHDGDVGAQLRGR